MNVYALPARDGFPTLTAGTPPFGVDAVLLTAAPETLGKEETELLALYRRYGRPVAVEAAELTDQPRSNYAPIDCNFYDNFEAAIVLRRTVVLTYKLTDGSETTAPTRLRDLRTHLSEEFVQLEGGEWVRLDRVVAVDGVPAGTSCRF